jgi:hypothetical protein
MDMKTVRFCVAAGFLLFLAVACDITTGDVPGEPVAVRVQIAGVEEGRSEEEVRSAYVSPLTGRRELAMVSQPIGDGMVMDVSLEPDESSPLRATKPLEAGKTFRVIALRNSDGTYVSHADFTIVDGVANSDADLHVPANVSHDFICLSHNDNSASGGLFAATYTKGVAPANPSLISDGRDFLYAEITKTISSQANATLSFTLTHQLCKLKMVIDATYNGWDITAISSTGLALYPAFANATMNMRTGAVTMGTQNNQYFTFPMNETNQKIRTSATRTMVYTGNNSVTVDLAKESITANGVKRPVAAQEISFASGSFYPVAGESYTLSIRIRIPEWAGSNVYWATNKLTFDAHGTTTREGYQGVFLKWGSLVGISPARTSGSVNFTSDTPVYIPNYVHRGTSTWSPTTVAAYSNISGMTGASSTDVSNTFLIDDARNDPTTMWANRLGDICQYLGATGAAPTGYRLPIAAEMGAGSSQQFGESTEPVAGGWVRMNNVDGTFYAASYADGTADFNSTANGTGGKLNLALNSVMGNVKLPISGTREASYDGELVYVNRQVLYWSGSTHSSGYARGLNIASHNIYHMTNGFGRGTASAVRCVRNL